MEGSGRGGEARGLGVGGAGAAGRNEMQPRGASLCCRWAVRVSSFAAGLLGRLAAASILFNEGVTDEMATNRPELQVRRLHELEARVGLLSSIETSLGFLPFPCCFLSGSVDDGR